nr:olfactory receptor 52K2-like [Loxodonta africana]
MKRKLTLAPDMPAYNKTDVHPSTFLLIGIPGLEASHIWISIPFCIIYLLALLGNFSILFVIKTDHTLYEPMYLLLCMLAVAHLIVCTTAIPKLLSVFWFDDGEIRFEACLTQVFLIHSCSTMESGFFLTMAIDCYVAICDPLHHATILTHTHIAKMGAAVVLWGVAFFFPHLILLRQLTYCRTKIIAHAYCEFMVVVKLACVDTGATKCYSLSVASIIGSCDGFFIAVSYVLILRAVCHLPSWEASFKALGTCGSHVCVILVFYSTAVFTFLTHRFGHNVAPQIHIFIANMYLLVPPFLNPIV